MFTGDCWRLAGDCRRLAGEISVDRIVLRGTPGVTTLYLGGRVGLVLEVGGVGGLGAIDLSVVFAVITFFTTAARRGCGALTVGGFVDPVDD